MVSLLLSGVILEESILLSIIMYQPCISFVYVAISRLTFETSHRAVDLCRHNTKCKRLMEISQCGAKYRSSNQKSGMYPR